jgi:hypothetical protein
MPSDVELRVAAVLEDQYSKQAEAATKAFDLLTKHLEKVEENTKATEETLKATQWLQYGQAALAAGKVVAQAVYSMAKATADFYIESVKIAADAEMGFVSLNSALETRGLTQYRDALNELATEIAGMSRYEDDAIRELETMLLTFKVAPQNMAAATRATVDFAAAMNIDLNTAARAVTQAMDGQAGALSRYGVRLDLSLVEPGKRAEVVLKALREQFGGRAQDEMGAFAVKITKLEQAFDDFREALGNTFIKTQVGQEIIAALTKALNDMEKWVTENGDVITEFVLALAQAIIGLTRIMADAAKKIVPALEDMFVNSVLGDNTKFADYQRNLQRVGNSIEMLGETGWESVHSLHNSWVDMGGTIGETAGKLLAHSRNQEELNANIRDFEKQLQAQLKMWDNQTRAAEAHTNVMTALGLVIQGVKNQSNLLWSDQAPRSFVDMMDGVLNSADKTLADLQDKMRNWRRETAAPPEEGGGQVALPGPGEGEFNLLNQYGDMFRAVMGGIGAEAQKAANEWIVTGQSLAWAWEQDYAAWAASLEGQRALQSRKREEEITAQSEREEYVTAHLDEILSLQMAATDAEYQLAVTLNQKKRDLDKQEQERQKRELATRKAVFVQGTQDMFGALAAVTEQGGKKMFALTKTFMYAEALVAGITSVQKAAASAPPPWNIPAIVAATAMMVANLAAIRSAEPGSSGGAPAGGGAGAAAGGGAPTPEPTAPTGEVGGVGEGRTLTVNANINGLAVVTDQTQLARAMAEALGAQRPFTIGSMA